MNRKHLSLLLVTIAGTTYAFAGCGDGNNPPPLPPAAGANTSATTTTGAQMGGGGEGGAPPVNCTNTVMDGDETDVDCGGSNCAACEPGEGCNENVDCTSMLCEDDVCAESSCTDGIKNGAESDVDCGGTCPNGCLLGQKCSVADDCAGDNCVEDQCLCPTSMDEAPAPGGGAYCIDKTEVIYDDYEKFYIANPPLSSQSAECQWNTDFTPQLNWPAPADQKEFPVVGLNWCEAQAYCTWAEKRLCGKIGGGRNALADYDDSEKSQWMNACSAQGNNVYAYGDNYNASVCNGSDFGTGGGGGGGPGPIEVQNGSGEPNEEPPCVGGLPDIWHMSGNVAEWEDSCNGTSGASDSCRIRGGSYLSGQADLTCAADASQQRDTVSPEIGFRCCL